MARIKINHKQWKRYLVTDVIYYVDPEECDENGCVRVYDKDTKELMCDNIHAYNAMFSDMEKIIKEELKPVFISEYAKEGLVFMQEILGVTK